MLPLESARISNFLVGDLYFAALNLFIESVVVVYGPLFKHPGVGRDSYSVVSCSESCNLSAVICPLVIVVRSDSMVEPARSFIAEVITVSD